MLFKLNEEYRDIIEFCFMMYEGELRKTTTFDICHYMLKFDDSLSFTEKEFICILNIVDDVNQLLLEKSAYPYPKSYMNCFKLSQKLMEKHNKYKDLKEAWKKVEKAP